LSEGQSVLTLFVYYKLPAAEHAAWQARVQAFCAAASARWPGLSVELMQRPQADAQGQETWMEVWRQPGGVAAGLAAELDALARAHGLPMRRAGELFGPLQA
jgi:hypothetical protein